MKKVIFIFIVILLTSGVAMQAQIPKSIEVKPGISLTKQYFKGDSEQKNKDNTYYPGLYVGVNVEFLQHKWMSILAEGGFTMKSYTSGGEQSLDYVYLSPMFKARKEFGSFIPYVFVGPRIDFLLRTKAEREYGSKEYLNKSIFGLIYGLGLEYNFWPFGIVVGFHQQYDFTNITTHVDTDGNETGLKQNTFVINLGLKAYFGNKAKSK